MIISFGYRVNSQKTTQFPIWAANVLKKHLIDGYTINEKRLKLAEHKYQGLQKSIKLLGNLISSGITPFFASIQRVGCGGWGKRN